MSYKESTSLIEVMNQIVNIRRYIDQPIPKNIEEDLFYAYSLGPSSVNVQARELLVIEKSDQRQKVVETTLDPYLSKGSYGGQAWILDAPLVCIALIEKRRAMARVGKQGLLVAVQDLAAAVQNFRLMAHVHQLSTSCVREFDKNMLQTNLDLPWYVEPMAILTAGYSDQEKDIPPRLPLSDIVSRGKWC